MRSAIHKAFPLLLVLIFPAMLLAQQDTFKVKNTEAVLISRSWMPLEGEPKTKGDEASLITDRSGVAILVNMFDGNAKAATHACGYHWRMTFVQRTGPPVDIYFNEKCEQFARNTAEICAAMQALFSEIRTSPKAFITNAGFDPAVAPDEAMRRLGAVPGFKVFQLRDLDSRFPFIEIEASAAVDRTPGSPWKEVEEKVTEKARETVRRDIARIREKYPVERIRDFQRTGGLFGPYNVETTERVRVLFPVGTDITAVETTLMESKFLAKEVPEVYYLQMVGTQRFPVSSKVLRAGAGDLFKTISAYGF